MTVTGSAGGALPPLGQGSRNGSPEMKRQIWIDVLKGMGIVLVVVGHVTHNDLLAKMIFMFHMPLFFLIGGWLHNTNTPERAYLKSKAFSLLVPYFSFLVILWPLELLVSMPEQRWTGASILTGLIKPMLVGGPLLTGFAAVFWFVTCYFLTQQLVHFLLRRYTMAQCALIFALMLVCAYLNAALLRQWFLPWSANAVLIAAPIYFIGYRARYWARSRGNAGELAKFMPVFAVVALIAVALNVLGYHNVFDIKAGDYGFPVVTLVSALACVALLAVIAQRLQASMVGRCLAGLGAASMTIMFLHQFVQLMMTKKLGIGQAEPRILVALLLCYLLHRLLNMSPLTARFFLGSQAPQPRLT